MAHSKAGGVETAFTTIIDPKKPLPQGAEQQIVKLANRANLDASKLVRTPRHDGIADVMKRKVKTGSLSN